MYVCMYVCMYVRSYPLGKYVQYVCRYPPRGLYLPTLALLDDTTELETIPGPGGWRRGKEKEKERGVPPTKLLVMYVL